MIIGDPYKFSIFIDIVDSWSSRGFVSGIFYITIDGNIFPKGLINTTLNSEMYMFFSNKRSSLLTTPVNIDLFNQGKTAAYIELYKTTFPDNDFENDYSYFCGFSEMADQNCYIFSVSNGDDVRILGAHIGSIEMAINGDEELDVSEVILPRIELDHILSNLENFYKKSIS